MFVYLGECMVYLGECMSIWVRKHGYLWAWPWACLCSCAWVRLCVNVCICMYEYVHETWNMCMRHRICAWDMEYVHNTWNMCIRHVMCVCNTFAIHVQYIFNRWGTLSIASFVHTTSVALSILSFNCTCIYTHTHTHTKLPTQTHPHRHTGISVDTKRYKRPEIKIARRNLRIYKPVARWHGVAATPLAPRLLMHIHAYHVKAYACVSAPQDRVGICMRIITSLSSVYMHISRWSSKWIDRQRSSECIGTHMVNSVSS